MKLYNNQRGTSLLIILIIGLLVGLTSMSTVRMSAFSQKKISTRRNSVSTLHIAEAGKERAYAEIKAGRVKPIADSLITVFNRVSFDRGYYTVTCSANVDIDTLWIRSTGRLRVDSTTIVVIYAPGKIKKELEITVDAAVTSCSDIILAGTVEIDGNDYVYSTGLVIQPRVGIFAVTAMGRITVSGAAKVGGNGFLPVKSESPLIINARSMNPLPPSTPEEALGLHPGDLDGYIQYVERIPSPLNFQKKIVYYCPDEQITEPLKINNSSGILIVHNKNTNAQIKNVHGTFSGIIISDQIVHINANSNATTIIYGAIYVLSTESGGGQFSNGGAAIRYCSQAISEAASIPVEIDGSLKSIAWFQE